MSKKTIIMKNRKIRGESRCADCLANKLFSDKKKVQIWARGFCVSIFNWLTVTKQKMLTYCVKCRKKTEYLDSKISITKNGTIIMLSKCALCEIKKTRFVKEQEAEGLLSNFGIKTPLNKIPLLGDIFFWDKMKKNRIKCSQIIYGKEWDSIIKCLNS